MEYLKSKKSMVSEEILIFLGTNRGRGVLFGYKLLGFVLDIIAIHAANTVVNLFEGLNDSLPDNLGIEYPSYEQRNPVFGAMLTIFLFERVCVFGFIWKYGFHPNKQYEKYALNQHEAADETEEPGSESKSITVDVNQGPQFNKEWLDNIGCGEYYSLFIDNGYEDFQTVLTLDDQGLIDIGIDKKGHRVKLLLNFHEIQNKPEHEQYEAKDDANESPQEEEIADGESIADTIGDKKKLEGIRSLWYGGLCKTSDYIAQIYKYKKMEHVKPIMAWYLFAILFLFILSIVYIIATFQKFTLDFAASLMNSIDLESTSDEEEGIEFGVFDAFMMFLSMAAVQFGLFRHVMAFGSLYNEKAEIQQNGPSDSGKTIKYISYCCGGIVFIVMILNIVALIRMMNFIAQMDDMVYDVQNQI